MAPRKLQVPVEILWVVAPDAPSHIIVGKNTSMHRNSNAPLRQISPQAGMYGTEKMANRVAQAIQKIPFIPFIALKLRDSSIPIVKGNSILRSPPQKLTVSSVQPTPIIP